MANPENKQIPYESTQKDIRDAIESVATAIGGIAVPSADHVSYDNSVSGLSATDVQNALDELANEKADSSTTLAGYGITDAYTKTESDAKIEALDYSDTAVSGSYVTEVDETDGVISVTRESADATPTDSSMKMVTSGGVKTALDLKQNTLTAGDGIDITSDVISVDAEVKTATDTFTTINGGLLEECIINLEPVQSGSGDPSPDNVRPISGHTEVDLYNVGKNKANISSSTVGSNQKVTVEYDNNIIRITATGTYSRCGWLIPVEVGKTYTFSCKGITSAIGGTMVNYIYLGSADGTWSDSSPNYISRVQLTTTSRDVNITFTATTNVCFIGAYVTSMATSGVMTLTDVQLELGSTATTFEPYLGHLYQVQIGSTVYGGSLDIVSGSGEDAYTNIASYNGETINEPWISSMDVYTEGGTPTTGAQVVYPKTTATAISTTPQQIVALVGENNLSTPLDGQSIDSVKYREVFVFDDVEKVVSLRVPISMLGTDESGRTTASQAYASGDYFYRNGYMCKALTSISAGATLTLNTNYSQGTLADVLKAIENA